MSAIVKEAINKLIKKNNTNSNNGEENFIPLISAAIKSIMAGEATQAQIGGLLVALQMEPVTAQLLESVSNIMLEFASPCNLGSENECSVDIVGTGGDGMDTFNVSTAAAFVISACGIISAKHGNRSSSGSVGSVDFLEALGARVDLDGNEVVKIISETKFGFLFAQMFHTSMKQVATARKEVGVRTVFNLLGPLTNPARPKYQITGVSNQQYGPIFAELFAMRKMKHALVVHSTDGLDEISPAAPTHAWFVRDGQIQYRLIQPSDFGLELHSIEEVSGGTANERAMAFRRAVSGEDQIGSPILDFILMNAAAALFVCDKVKDFKEGVEMAKAVIEAGKVSQLVDKYVAFSRAMKCGVGNGVGSNGTVLNRIAAKRRKDVEEEKKIIPMEALKQATLKAPLVTPFFERLSINEGVSIIAEIKRASPSKGDIAPNIVAAEQGVVYATSGAAAISVLTEPTWFKGSLQDLANVRAAVDYMGINRPAILCKDFILDEYQVYNARVHGADSILLIVSMLSDEEIIPLLNLSRSLGMEPLVEVATNDEMQRAVKLGAKVIGINNRDLHSFTVDMGRTERVIRSASSESSKIIFCALSGIDNRVHVQRFATAGAHVVLVGEALMRSSDVELTIQTLKGFGPDPLVKICGVKDVNTALETAKSGADLIGLVFAPGSSRCIDTTTARDISDAIHNLRLNSSSSSSRASLLSSSSSSSYETFSSSLQKACSLGPLVVGVFANQPQDQVLKIAQEADLDIIQLSGNEGMTVAPQYAPYPVLKAIHVGAGMTSDELVTTVSAGGPAMTLLDTKDASSGALGGTGKSFDWSVAVNCAEKYPLFLAGGLDADNVRLAVKQVHPFGLDVSSGVEKSAGVKDMEKIAKFVQMAKHNH